MQVERPRRRRIRRLALAGVLWAFALWLLVGAVVARTPRVHAGFGRLPARAPTTATSRADAHLGHVVAVLAGRGAIVYCWSPRDWTRRTSEVAARWPRVGRLGAWRAYTSTAPVLSVNLSPPICGELARLGRPHEHVWREEDVDGLAWAVETLAHESMHVAGVASEVKAECYGIQKTATAARLLGATAREARYLADVYVKRWYAWHARRYRSPECRNGGRLDLRPRSDVWP